jgi:hypothetical protein
MIVNRPASTVDDLSRTVLDEYDARSGEGEDGEGCGKQHQHQDLVGRVHFDAPGNAGYQPRSATSMVAERASGGTGSAEAAMVKVAMVIRKRVMSEILSI